MNDLYARRLYWAMSFALNGGPLQGIYARGVSDTRGGQLHIRSEGNDCDLDCTRYRLPTACSLKGADSLDGRVHSISV